MSTKMNAANARKVLDYIERTTGSIEDELRLRPPGKPSITLTRITGLKLDSDGHGWIAQEHEVTYSFPGKTKEEAWRFGKMLRHEKNLLIM